VTDVAFKFARQVLDRSEDSAGDDIALDPGEPVFNLIEPGGVGPGVMEMDFGTRRAELLLVLVGREVVGNEMDPLAARLIGDYLGKKGEKLLAARLQREPSSHCSRQPPVCGICYTGKLTLVWTTNRGQAKSVNAVPARF
jgi:hypothetical protein